MAEGKYELKPLAAGKYDIRFVATGYQDLIMPQQEVLSGTITTLNVSMTTMP